MADLLEQIAQAIERQEGFHKTGSRSQRNNNPGNLKMGRFARLFGASAMDEEHHAIFPSVEHGRMALRVLLWTKFRGQTLRQVGEVYAEDRRWAENVSKISGLDKDTVIA